MTKNQTTSAKLAAYGAMGLGTMTFGATAANAEICFTDLTGSELVFTSTSPAFAIDVDGNGLDDFSFSMGTFGPNGFGSNSWMLLANVASTAQAGLALAGPATPPALGRILQGGSISGRSFDDSGYLQRAYTSYTPSVSYGAWLQGSSGYAGIRFEDSTGTTRFGWIELAVEGSVTLAGFDSIAVTVSGYAFAKDEAITAGQTTSAVPEPTALGLLALGGVGVMARRRRKDE